MLACGKHTRGNELPATCTGAAACNSTRKELKAPTVEFKWCWKTYGGRTPAGDSLWVVPRSPATNLCVCGDGEE